MRASRLVDHPSPRLSVALACAEGEWPHEEWPAPEDPYVGRALRVFPPYRELGEQGAVDVVVLRCEEPATAFGVLLKAMGAVSAPVIVVSPRRDTQTVIEVFRGGAGYLVEGDYCTCMLASAVMAATVGHTYLSPVACAALREGAQRVSEEGRGASVAGAAMERLRSLLSPRERQIMELLSTGLGAQEIGLRLRLSEKTVRNNLSNIYAKLDARGSTDAVLRWLGATPAVRI
ncbi:response regulator transcription factor [Streptomyces turgidiscabies]|uniref:response regulator transcription factor n=1 Tax=Streptomyces turgidiscabies TaxID=85558 RepID=UPI00073FA5BA|nr:response regulator transcription factor [Streptomyces turgidiscabies]MDX3493173.1 response regulator transcription factor [Streptomyces turgidiscabies]GAQ70470.1 transcriptional regulatory protein DegU [Streptomyces turgidiscabies]